MATEELVGGNALAWTSLMSTELNGLASASAIYSTTTIDNGTNNDLFAEFSVVLGSILTGTPAYLGLYLYPRNGDNTTFGDGRFSGAAAGPPPSNYYRGFCGFPSATTAVQSGSFAVPGTSNFMIPLPRGLFKVVIHNGSGAILAGSGNTLYWRSTNLVIA